MKRLAAILLLLLSSCSPPPAPPKTEMWESMGTLAAVSVPAGQSPKLAEYTASARAILEELDKTLSIYTTDSEISRMNRTAGGTAVPVSPRTAEVLTLARHYAELSGGVFDPTVAPLVLLWGFSGGEKPSAVPAANAIEEARLLTGSEGLQISNGTARLARPGMKVDLGGIAKGYAVDVCYEQIRARGGTDVLVNLGGNLRCCGQGRKDRPWTIAVRNPFDDKNPLGTIALSDGLATASSGNYERFVTIEGKRYAHIIDPRTGFPSVGMAGTAVICTNATEADAMSTTAFILGPERARELMAKLQCEALFVPDEQPLRILVTPGFRARFTPAAGFADRVSVLEAVRDAETAR
jgi:FAD:protein FMN transferase